MFHLPLQLLYGLVALEEDAVGTNMGASSELDPCDLREHEPYLVALDVGGRRIYPCRHDRDFDFTSSS
jgi:hypothetical protein